MDLSDPRLGTARGYVFPPAAVRFHHTPSAGSPRFLCRSFPARCSQPPRVLRCTYVRLFFTGSRFHHIRRANHTLLRNEAESDLLALRLAGSHFEASPYGLLRTALDSYMSNG